MLGIAHASQDGLNGASWVAAQDITFPVRRTSVTMQDGEISQGRQNRGVPHCEVQARKSVNETLTIKKGARFNITRVNHSSEVFNTANTIFQTTMRVEAKEYPQIRTFSCRVWSNRPGSHVSAEQMQQAMQGLFVLEK